MAVAGTPDSNAYNLSTGSAANTGANAACISNYGTNDMIGNLWEWAAAPDGEHDLFALVGEVSVDAVYPVREPYSDAAPAERLVPSGAPV